MELPAVNLKAIILVHWLLTVWGCMNHMFPASYAWGNFSVLAVGIWAIAQRDSLDAIMMFLTGLLLTVLTDIIHVSVFYPPNNYLTDVKRFSIGMAIFSLLLKPMSCYLVYRMYRERGGEYTFNIDLESSSDSHFAHNASLLLGTSLSYGLVPTFDSDFFLAVADAWPIGVTCAGRDRSTYETIDQQDAPPQWPDSSKTAQQPY